MNNFGLGLVLDFTDNASAGMTNAARTLNNLSATADQVSGSVGNSAVAMYAIAQSMTQVGDTMVGIGSSILGVFTTIGKKILDTGMTMQQFRMQMNALYGETEGEAKIQEIQQYAATSVFEVEGLMKAVTTMKAVGIEAMDDVTTSTGQTTQKLMDYASDLAAMMPAMRNVYGTGVNAAMGAFKEFIAEGNAVSLKRGAGLDITQILGEEKGTTIEERTRQVADLIEKLGIAGYTAQLYGTPMQQISNINDVVFNTLARISDSGVFDTFCQLLSTAATFITDLTEDEERFAVITDLIGDVISTLMSPLQKLLDMIITNADAIISWTAANPKLAKTIALVVAGLGALLVLGGTVLKFSGNILMLMNAMRMARDMGGVFSFLRTGFASLLKSMLPVIAVAGLLYAAWNSNFMGFRDLVSGTLKQVATVFSLTFDALSDGAMSIENYNLAESLGLLPFIETLLDVRYRFGLFVDGFKQGFRDIADFFTGLFGEFENTDSWLYSLLSSVGEFFKSLMGTGPEVTETWNNIGSAIAKVVAAILAVVAVFKVVGTIVTVITKIVSFVKGIITAIRGVVTAVRTVIGIVKTIPTIISGIGAAVKGALALIMAHPVVAIVVAIVAAVIALGVAIYKNWDSIKAVLSQVGSWIYNNIILPVRNFFATLLNFIVGFVVTVWGGIKSVIGGIATWVNNNVIIPIQNFATSLWNSIVGLWTQFSGWVNANIITPVVTFFTGLWTSIVNIATSLWNDVMGVISPIATWIDTNIIQPVVEFFNGLWTSITDIFNSIRDAITGAFQSAYDTVMGVWEGITGFFSGIWNSISSVVGKITGAGEKVTGIKSSIPAAAHGVDNFVGGLLQVNEEGGELINLPSGSTVIPHDNSIEESMKKGIQIGANTMALYARNASVPAQPAASSGGDSYVVTFAAGSVIVKCSNTSDAELEKAADKLLKIIKRKAELKKMAQRQTRKPVYA